MRVDIAKIDRKLDNMIATSEFAKLQDVVIFQDIDGTYNLFNKYHIRKKDVNNIVVSLNNGDDVNSFFSMKNAVCWCVFDKIGKYQLANRVIDLDIFDICQAAHQTFSADIGSHVMALDVGTAGILVVLRYSCKYLV